MIRPPPALAGLRVVLYAEVSDDVIFEQRCTLNVDGKWLERVPYLAICQEFDEVEFAVQHCGVDWEPLGIAAGYKSVDKAKVAVERSYHGIAAKWVASTATLDEARSFYEAERRASACSFCGRTLGEVTAMVGDSVRICGRSIDDFHAAIHEGKQSP
jgi:hypothetical protein